MKPIDKVTEASSCLAVVLFDVFSDLVGLVQREMSIKIEVQESLIEQMAREKSEMKNKLLLLKSKNLDLMSKYTLA